MTMKTTYRIPLLSLLTVVCIAIIAAAPAIDSTSDAPRSDSEEIASLHNMGLEDDALSGKWEADSGWTGKEGEYYIRAIRRDDNGQVTETVILGRTKEERKAKRAERRAERASKKLADALNEVDDNFMWDPSCEGGDLGPTMLC